MSDEKKEVKLTEKLEKIAKQIEELTVLELADLAKHLEEVFGVSGMPMMGGMMAAPAAGAAEPAEEKTEFTVEITEAGANKLSVIKAVREIVPTLGLIDAKKLVESAPAAVVENVKKEAADEAKAKLEAAGAKVTLK